MVAPLILVRDNNGDLHDQEGHLRNAARREAARRRFRGRKSDEFWRVTLVSIDTSHRESIDIHQLKLIDWSTKESIDRISRASTDDTNGVNCFLQCDVNIDRQPPVSIDRRAPITYRVQIPKIDVACLNALRPNPKPSENPPDTVRIPSDDGEDSMKVDRAPMGRTLRKRKEKVEKHLKRGANDKETSEKEEDIKRIFCEVREKMRKTVTLKKKSEPGEFAIPCTVKDHLGLQVEPSNELFTFVDCSQKNSGGIVRDLEVQISNALVPIDFHVLDIKLSWNSSILLGRAFFSIVGAVCNLQSNQLCLTLIDPQTHCDPIPIKKPQMSFRTINDPGIIAACHCGVEYETEYSASIETHTATLIDSVNQKSIDKPQDESVDSRPDDWENDYYNPTIAAYTRQNMHIEEYDEDYEDERDNEYKSILDEEDTLLHHSSWKRNAPSIDITSSPSIDTKPHQRNRKRASTGIANYSSIDAEVNRVREGDYSTGSWADDHHHESYALETSIYEPGAYELHEGFTYEELLNMKRRDETYQHRSETAWGRTRYSHPIDRASCPSIHINPSTSIDIRSKPKKNYGHARAIDGRILNVSRKDIADILQTANGAEILIVHQRNIPEYQQKDIKEFYDATSGIDKSFKQRSRHHTRPSIDVYVPTSVDRRPEFRRGAFDSHGTRKFYWEEKNEYGVYRDEQGYSRDLEGHTICVHNRDIRRLLERASRDEPSYICLPEHANLFTQTKLVPEIYTKDVINEMFYGVCGAQEKNECDFQMKLDGVYHPLNDSIGWLTTCMEEMRQDITRIQQATNCSRHKSIDRRQHASIDSRLPTSIDQGLPASIDNSPPHSHPMKSPQKFHTREEIDQLVEEIYRALDTTKERLDGICDDIYFPMYLSISALTSKIEAMQGESVEIQSYITRRPKASASIDRCNNIVGTKIRTVDFSVNK
ncbi:hypothetical protein F2Q69_00012975 [Brassica cretica]|uniref:Uncharacterized protein n=1 Tax=Brassica cretica TaxID=69181 RepID=A0A8S9QZ17_BRACR|nr:hypothetical protein F2Q69_00012975 [Brassica cretica]